MFLCIKSYYNFIGRAGRLTWHSNAIPSDQIHIKIGGDAGGGTFKMAFQVANLEKPNSKSNTVVFNIFQAKDTWSNLKTGLSVHINQIEELKLGTWRYKHV